MERHPNMNTPISSILQKRMNKNVKYFDSGDYNLARAVKQPSVASQKSSHLTNPPNLMCNSNAAPANQQQPVTQSEPPQPIRVERITAAATSAATCTPNKEVAPVEAVPPSRTIKMRGLNTLAGATDASKSKLRSTSCYMPDTSRARFKPQLAAIKAHDDLNVKPVMLQIATPFNVPAIAHKIFATNQKARAEEGGATRVATGGAAGDTQIGPTAQSYAAVGCGMATQIESSSTTLQSPLILEQHFMAGDSLLSSSSPLAAPPRSSSSSVSTSAAAPRVTIFDFATNQLRSSP